MLPVRRRSRPLPDTMRHDLDLKGAQRVRLDMSGGAMGSMTKLVVAGKEREFEELVGLKKVWGFNGVGGDMAEPLFRVERGRTVRLQIPATARAGRTPCTFTATISRCWRGTASATRTRDWRDTVLNDPMETLDLAFDAANPGRWLLHCHMARAIRRAA